MADILIRGMEMPNNCGVCRLVQHRVFANTMQCPITGDIVGYYDEGLHLNEHNCPLVPLPEGHGDLIDKKAFKADIDGFIECMTKVGAVVDGEMLWGKLLDALDNAKPIVPAEGGTDNGN